MSRENIYSKYEAENSGLRERLKKAEELLSNYYELAKHAMWEANNDGAEYDISAELKDYKDYLEQYKN